MTDDAERKPGVFSSEQVSGRDLDGSSLMPMLIVGLILVSVGYLALMVFF